MQTKIYDFIAVGLGPFNLSLACLTEPIEELEGLFLEKNSGFDWHPGMLMPSTTLQIPFMADLVTLADPTSPYSFLNYIKKQGRIYSFYIRENFLVLRNEYNQYCQWVIQQLSNVRFNQAVEEIHYQDEEGCYYLTVTNQETQATEVYRAKRLVLGTGTSPTLPSCCDTVKEDLVHSANYLFKKKALQQQKSITIVGSGQSAAEIYHDLLQEIEKGYELHWITRSPRFFPLEYSKLTLEMTSPEYVDYFHALPAQKRDNIIGKQKHLYKGINSDLINEIYDLLYTHQVAGVDMHTTLRTHSALTAVRKEGNEFQLTLHQQEEDKHYSHRTEGLVMATGYGYKQPKFIDPIEGRIKWDDQGRYDVNRNYSIDQNANEIFVQNAELHTHGFVTPDLGMGCYRNAYIIKEMTGVEHYPVERKIAFQQFGVSQEEELMLDYQ
ncbi:MAG TPA: alcaligin biosynthesis protein [Microscillaceae bacterium]|nr:alcaligin biosynthesis protein [Microscillaceae bacterium]